MPFSGSWASLSPLIGVLPRRCSATFGSDSGAENFESEVRIIPQDLLASDLEDPGLRA
jgi:hypothetical protein